MDVSLLLRVAGVGLLVALTSQILSKTGRDEQSLLLTLTAMIVVFLMLVQEIGTLFDAVKDVFGIW